MKNSSLIPVLFAATLFLGPALRAEESADPAVETQAAKHKRHAEILHRFDANGDGKLDEAEKTAAKLEMRKEGGPAAGADNGDLRKRILKRFDANHDGTLDPAERAQAADAVANNPRVIRRFDADGDGKLDESERAKARAALQKQLAKRKAGAKAAPALAPAPVPAPTAPTP